MPKANRISDQIVLDAIVASIQLEPQICYAALKEVRGEHLAALNRVTAVAVLAVLTVFGMLSDKPSLAGVSLAPGYLIGAALLYMAYLYVRLVTVDLKPRLFMRYFLWLHDNADDVRRIELKFSFPLAFVGTQYLTTALGERQWAVTWGSAIRLAIFGLFVICALVATMVLWIITLIFAWKQAPADDFIRIFTHCAVVLNAATIMTCHGIYGLEFIRRRNAST